MVPPDQGKVTLPRLLQLQPGQHEILIWRPNNAEAPPKRALNNKVTFYGTLSHGRQYYLDLFRLGGHDTGNCRTQCQKMA